MEPPNAVHFTLQGKGGVGKSLVSALLAQYFQTVVGDVKCIDTDPVNQTLVRLGYQLKEIAEFLADDGKGGGIEVDAQALADVVAAGSLGTRSKAGLPVPITGNMPEL